MADSFVTLSRKADSSASLPRLVGMTKGLARLHYSIETPTLLGACANVLASSRETNETLI